MGTVESEIRTTAGGNAASVEHASLVGACAISLGIHAALTPQHLHEGAGPGAGFLASAVLLAVVVAWSTLRPADRTAVAAAGAVLAGLLAAYALAVTTGVPVLHPEPEPVEGLALVTKVVEGAGVLAAALVLSRRRDPRPPSLHDAKGASA